MTSLQPTATEWSPSDLRELLLHLPTGPFVCALYPLLMKAWAKGQQHEGHINTDSRLEITFSDFASWLNYQIHILQCDWQLLIAALSLTS